VSQRPAWQRTRARVEYCRTDFAAVLQVAAIAASRAVQLACPAAGEQENVVAGCWKCSPHQRREHRGRRALRRHGLFRARHAHAVDGGHGAFFFFQQADSGAGATAAMHPVRYLRVV
jgi:hypothetical protein